MKEVEAAFVPLYWFLEDSPKISEGMEGGRRQEQRYPGKAGEDSWRTQPSWVTIVDMPKGTGKEEFLEKWLIEHSDSDITEKSMSERVF